jgi:hypothetical protein
MHAVPRNIRAAIELLILSAFSCEMAWPQSFKLAGHVSTPTLYAHLPIASNPCAKDSVSAPTVLRTDATAVSDASASCDAPPNAESAANSLRSSPSGCARRPQDCRSETIWLFPTLSVRTKPNRNKRPYRRHCALRSIVPAGWLTVGEHSWESCAPHSSVLGIYIDLVPAQNPPSGPASSSKPMEGSRTFRQSFPATDWSFLDPRKLAIEADFAFGLTLEHLLTTPEIVKH